MIKLGTSDMAKACVGSTEVSKMYLGSELVYSKETEVLPYDAEIEYLESTGTQYINTGYIPDGTDIQILGKFYLSKYAAVWGRWFSAFTDEQAAAYRIMRYNSDDKSIQFNCGGAATGGGKKLSINGLNYLYNFDISNDHAIINNVSHTYQIQKGNTNTNPLLLFAPGSSGTTTSGKFYFFKLLKNGITVLDLIPVRKDGIGYMYDKVSGQLLGNAGTGSFILGNDIV